MPLKEIRALVRKTAPEITAFVFDCLCSEASMGIQRKQSRKPVNDPVWKTIWLEAHEVALLDSLALQRLRRVRQLGLAYLVYPGAQHTRFDHSVGATEAATRMFDRLAAGSFTDRASADETKKVVRLAALLHDCGHPAFSHLGENIIGHLLSSQFKSLSEALARELNKAQEASRQDKASGNLPSKAATENPKTNKPAEVMSALILAAPATQQLLSQYGVTETQICEAIALILGFSIGKRERDKIFSFVDFIVSGDLDIDKVDYVARDAYFSGIPISSDVDRLINQLTPALKGGDGDGGRYMFGIRHSGVSPVEMFVMTRAYLFDRLYRHPKIRAVEKFVERGAVAALSKASPTELLELMYCSAGDDGCLALLKDRCPPAAALLARNVPVRALAVGPRMMVGYDEAVQDSSTGLGAAWVTAKFDLQQPDDFHDEVCTLAGLGIDRAMFFYDEPPPGTLSENPDIWVTEPHSDLSARRINSLFDTERFSNAYHDRHTVNWIFAASADKNVIAAASALVLAERYGLVVTLNAAREAKIRKHEFVEAIDTIYERIEDGLRIKYREAFDLVRAQSGDQLVLPSAWVTEICPKSWTDTEKGEFAEKFLKQLSAAKLPSLYGGELDNCLRVVEASLRHADSILGHATATDRFKDEDAFQQDVFKYLNHPQNRQSNWGVDSGGTQSHGTLDIGFAAPAGRGKVALELKSELQPFNKLVANHAGQAREYASASGYSHFSVLYVESQEDTAIKPSQLLEIRGPETPGGSKLITICVALPRRKGSASLHGKGSAPLG